MSVALGLALVGVLTAASAPQRSYADVLASFRSGAFNRAVAEVLGNADTTFNDDIAESLDRARELKDLPTVRAEFLLHTEVAFATADAMFAGTPTRPRTAVATAFGRVESLRRILVARDRDSPFLRQWYLLWGAYLQARNAADVPAAFDYMSVAVNAFPDDPEILLMAGSAKELTWWTTKDNPQRRTDGKSGSAERVLREAREYFRKAVAASISSPDEVRLRLGRTLMLLEDYDGAATQLASVQALEGNPSLSYLGKLFLGNLHERRNDAAAAAAAYEDALRLLPFGQSAQLAVSQLAHRAGARKRAADLAASALAEQRPPPDPWWWYISGQAWQLESRLQAARRMVMP
jgi:tetratricopeptide (TPR) repeat protein